MGLIKGSYDAKEEGFVPGGASLHNCMSAHGPDSAVYEQAIRSHINSCVSSLQDSIMITAQEA